MNTATAYFFFFFFFFFFTAAAPRLVIIWKMLSIFCIQLYLMIARSYATAASYVGLGVSQ
jgi:hypothetical protein